MHFFCDKKTKCDVLKREISPVEPFKGFQDGFIYVNIVKIRSCVYVT